MVPRRPRDATPHGPYDDVLLAWYETCLRFMARHRAVIDAGPYPDEEAWFAVLELELACDWWRSRFVAALARLGMTVDDVLDEIDQAA